jgi:hypothetical protein
MFFGLPCLIWKLVVVIVGVMKKGTPIPPCVKIAGEMEIKSLAIAGGWSAGQRIHPPNTMKHAVPLPSAGLIQVTGKLIMISGVRANGTHAGGRTTKIQKVRVRSGQTLAETVTHHLKRGCLIILAMEKMNGRLIIIVHGDLTPPKVEGGESHLITNL